MGPCLVQWSFARAHQGSSKAFIQQIALPGLGCATARAESRINGAGQWPHTTASLDPTEPYFVCGCSVM